MRLGIYEVINATSTTLEFRKLTESTYFGSKLIAQRDKNGTTERVMTDRLGSVVLRASTRFTYYPYGEEKGAPTTNDREKFGTYYRDSFTGLDYADQRYYTTGFGRFTTPDPYKASAGTNEPGSWNRYAYVTGDPINRFDPDGREQITVTATYPPELRLLYDRVRRAFVESLTRATDEEPISQLEAELAAETFNGRLWAIQGLNALPQGCKEFFSRHKNSSGVSLMDRVSATIGQTRFVDGFSTNGVSRSTADVGIYTSTPMSVGTLIESNPLRKAANASVYGNTVLLHYNWAKSSGAQKAQTIMHEILHSMLGPDADEWSLAELLGANKEVIPQGAARNTPFEIAGASGFISEQLSGGCSAGLRSLNAAP